MIAQFLINSLITSSSYALTSIGFVIIYRVTNFFNFSHGSIFSSGSYLLYTFIVFCKFNFIVAFFLSLIGSGLIGVLINYFVYYPLRNLAASNLACLIASFGVFTFIQNILQIVYGSEIFPSMVNEIKEGNHFLDAIITDNQILVLVASVTLYLVLFLFSKNTKIGKSMRAVADDPIAASIVGINPERTIAISFFIGSALAGAAGILISLETNLEPTMGLNAILKGIIASIIGGIGSIPGALLGGLFLGLAENLGTYWIDAAWKDTIAFGILIVFLLFKPTGILGKPTGKERL
jgi:branched-chain amino acid transport system permease protein